MKFYMEKGAEWAWPLSEFIDRIRDGEKEIILEEMKKDIGGEIFCTVDWYFGDESECGQVVCNRYNPCNGKSGRCRYLKNGYAGTGKMFKLTNKGLEVME